ncbi:MAG: hypothetical protein HN712_00675 [Gemmatimonadetes bacterium]|jgi:hypothetical protein|nr:hypothetical protein [Gemmatimonadota bacterium]MBT6148331.1 hypothetical protein [Gemmatimonadota bacterium]MBT7858783.1 hypothetical protein [Gemmatimonadota bacterium]
MGIAASLRAFLAIVVVMLFVPRPVLPATINAGPTTSVGTTVVQPNTEFVIYAVRIQRDPPPQERVLQIGVVVEDLTAPLGPTGLALTDFNQLRLWVSTNATFDGGDNLVGSVAQAGINLSGETDVPGGVNLLPGGGGRWYLVTAVLGPGAINGHAFRVSASVNNIDIDQNPPGPGGFDGLTDVILDGQIVAANANRFEIGGIHFSATIADAPNAGGGSSSIQRSVPIRGLWLAAMAILAFGAYRLRSLS